MTKRRSIAQDIAKRALDIVASAGGLAVLAVPLFGVAAAVRLESDGPVFYRGERIGLRGRPFRLFKFRSMFVRETKGPDTTSDTDNRITRVGRVIRRLKVDELPQLINVLVGEMSLVGPRPEVKWCVDLYTDDEKEILTVRPGITDWSSLRFHNEGEIIKASGYADPDQAYLDLIRPEKLRLQLKYVHERSFAIDLSIIWQTISTIFRTRVATVGNSGSVAHPPSSTGATYDVDSRVASSGSPS